MQTTSPQNIGEKLLVNAFQWWIQDDPAFYVAVWLKILLKRMTNQAFLLQF